MVGVMWHICDVLILQGKGVRGPGKQLAEFALLILDPFAHQTVWGITCHNFDQYLKVLWKNCWT